MKPKTFGQGLIVGLLSGIALAGASAMASGKAVQTDADVSRIANALERIQRDGIVVKTGSNELNVDIEPKYSSTTFKVEMD